MGNPDPFGRILGLVAVLFIGFVHCLDGMSPIEVEQGVLRSEGPFSLTLSVLVLDDHVLPPALFLQFRGCRVGGEFVWSE